MGKNVLDDLVIEFGVWGEKLGLLMIICVSLWDIAFTGARNLLHYSIGIKGMVVIWAGVILILASKHINRSLK